jgi:LytS/YehU family sensor histidine kinase
LIPRFILAKKYKRYIFFLLLSLGILYVCRVSLNYLLGIEYVYPAVGGVQVAFTFDHIISHILGELYVLAFATSIKLTIDWASERRRVERIKKIQLKTELNYLNSQIQPHFFFNTLNNLYALTIEKSDTAPSVVLKLSDIMQYVLYEAREPMIRLYDEINYIQNYLDLERLRYGDRIISNMDIVGSLDEIEVPPLLFLPFIENCFKHGVNEDNLIEVNISLEIVKNKMLKFRVENMFEKFDDTTIKHGIGVKNVKRRLELLFENNFELKTTINGQKYCVQLKIPINEN